MKYLKYFESYKNLISSFPSEEFEKAIGMEGLSEDYFLPDGYDYNSIYTLLSNDDDFGKIEELYYQIVKLNPELEAVTIYDSSNIWTTMQGICSKFLVQDIIWFDRLFNYDKRELLKYNQEVEPYKHWVYKKTGVPMSWVPCPDTLKKVIDFVKERY